MSQNTLSSTSQSDQKPLLKPDFSHQISFGYSLEDEFLGTLTVLGEELTGIFGALIHLLQTTEENKLGAAIATCIDQELKNFGSLLNNVSREEDVTDLLIEKLRASHAELEKMNNVLDECLDGAENDQFGFNLAITTYRRLRDIEALLNAYCEQREKVEVTEEPAMDSGIEGGAEGTIEDIAETSNQH